MKRSVNRKPWHPESVARRVEQARGALIARTGVDVRWSEIGRQVGWASATITQVRNGRRPLRVEEIGDISELLECSPGWLAFGEGPMWGRSDGIAPIEPGVDSFTTGEDAAEATAREIAENARAAEEEAQRRRRRASGQGPVDPASGGRAPGSGRGTPAKRPRDR